MKNKRHVIEQLEADLVKYCKQIGILTSPLLVFDPKIFDQICDHKMRRASKRYLGLCCRVHKLIMVNTEYPRAKVWRDQTWNSKRRVYTKVAFGLREARYTLVHELVHYRWPSFAEGRRQHERTRQVLGGRVFDPMPPSPITENGK